jgi:hypothetical protein
MKWNQSIPLTPQTNPANFPTWVENAPRGESGCNYPKALNRVCTDADVKNWIEKNRHRDQVTKEDYWLDRPPAAGSLIPVTATALMVDAGLAEKVGDDVVCQDEEEEARVRVFLGLDHPSPAPTAIDIPIRAAIEVETPRPKRRSRRKPIE